MPHSVPEHSDSSPKVEVNMEETEGAGLPSPHADCNDRDGGEDVAMGEPVDQDSSNPAAKDVKLEELFADVDSDDEFPASAEASWAAPAVSSSPDVPSPPGDIAISLKASDPEVMKSFYQRLFPWRYLFQWLNHSPTPSNDFCHREFSFTVKESVWRYLAYPTSDLLRKDVVQQMPSKFDIGPVYTTNPRDRKTMRNTSAFKPLSKELCFDIDLTDYDDIRTCCEKANICIKCWQFMTMAIKVLDGALRDDFGFKHVMWVYSGRRGVHAWVCDKKARTMDDQKRRAIASYLEVIRGGAQSGKKVNLRRPLHPHLTRSLEVLKSHFQEDVLEGQDPWQTSERAEKLLQLLPDRQLNDSLRKKWDSAPGRASTSKWADIDAVAKTGASKALDPKALLEAKQDIVLEYTYPRLDIEVSKKLNHLLKSPFVVHPGTGRVCVPIDTTSFEDFDPMGVPTVQTLLQEIDAWQEPEDERAGKPIQDWEKTSLKPYVEYFRSFVLGLLRDERDVKVKREREDGQPSSLEF